jgi:hypothetical protein
MHPGSFTHSYQQGGVKVTYTIPQPQSLQEKSQCARKCAAGLHLGIPILLDSMDSKATRAWKAFPTQVFGIGLNGKIGYNEEGILVPAHGATGKLFSSLERWLKLVLDCPSALEPSKKRG